MFWEDEWEEAYGKYTKVRKAKKTPRHVATSEDRENRRLVNNYKRRKQEEYHKEW
jgi:hypothetical protein